MKYRHSPDGSLRFSEMGLGTYALAGVYGRKDPGQFKRVVGRALDLGVTFFDAARTYGHAEAVLGKALAGFRPQVVISTKVAASLEEGFCCSYDAVVRSCDQSLKNLQTDFIDLYQIHFDDGVTPPAEVIRAMEHLKAAGKIRAYGIGHISYERAEDYLRQGSVATLMGELSAAAPRYHRKMLPLARGHGAGYIGFSLTGRGILTGALEGRVGLEPDDLRNMDALFTGERLKSALRIRDGFARLGRQAGATPAQVAIRWALSQDAVVTGLVGPSTVAHLEEDVKAVDLAMPDEVQREVNRLVTSEEERLRATLRAEIAAILGQPVTGPEQVPRLVYALEGLADLELAPEADLIGHFKTVISVMQGAADAFCLDRMRGSLTKYLET
jgi:aryl-alcohol dehydrogenase-like predicted oxidoreductase